MIGYGHFQGFGYNCTLPYIMIFGQIVTIYSWSLLDSHTHWVKSFICPLYIIQNSLVNQTKATSHSKPSAQASGKGTKLLVINQTLFVLNQTIYFAEL